MTRVVFLDAGVITIATHPRANADALECLQWLEGLAAAKARICIAEISDYEVRREYVRRADKGDVNAGKALKILERLTATLTYVPIETPAMRRAAALWAEARNRGRPTAGPKEIDCDVVLSAQALLAIGPGESLIVATDNIRHLAQYVPAATWRSIPAH